MITLKMTESDYYDGDTDEYVMVIGASVTSLQTDVKIRDLDGSVWDCYLNTLEFVPGNKRGKRDIYIARYKVY